MTTEALVAVSLKEVHRRMIKLTLDLQFVMHSQTGYSTGWLSSATPSTPSCSCPLLRECSFFCSSSSTTSVPSDGHGKSDHRYQVVEHLHHFSK